MRADYDADVRQRKADYLFLEALRQRQLEKPELSSALMDRALELTDNKSDREAFEVGSRRMLIGQINRDSLELADGLALCERYFAANPSDLYSGSYLANYYAETGNPDRAIEIYGILEAEKPGNSSLQLSHADLLLSRKRLPEALDLYRKIEQSMGRNSYVTQRIANCLFLQADTVGAMAELDDFIASQPRSVEALQVGAFMATRFNRPRQALEYIEKALELDPTNGATYYHAANIYKILNRNDDYEAAISGAIHGDDLDLEPKIELLRFFIGEELNPDGTGADKVDPLFETLVSQYTHDAELRSLYASYLISLKRFREAAEQMEQVVALDSSNPQDFIVLAQLYGSSDNLNRMIDATDLGLKVYPSEIRLYELKAGAQSRLELFDEALQTLHDALQTDSLTTQTRSDLYRDMADIAQQAPGAGTDSIKAYYEQSLKLNPENDLAMNNYAYWLSVTEGGDLLRAKDLISKAVVFDPGSATYYDTFAWVCYKLGDLENAKRYIDMALLFDKSDTEGAPEQLAELLGHAADIYDRLGQPDKAAEYRTRAENLKNQSSE